MASYAPAENLKHQNISNKATVYHGEIQQTDQLIRMKDFNARFENITTFKENSCQAEDIPKEIGKYYDLYKLQYAKYDKLFLRNNYLNISSSYFLNIFFGISQRMSFCLMIDKPIENVGTMLRATFFLSSILNSNYSFFCLNHKVFNECEQLCLSYHQFVQIYKVEPQS